MIQELDSVPPKSGIARTCKTWKVFVAWERVGVGFSGKEKRDFCNQKKSIFSLPSLYPQVNKDFKLKGAERWKRLYFGGWAVLSLGESTLGCHWAWAPNRTIPVLGYCRELFLTSSGLPYSSFSTPPPMTILLHLLYMWYVFIVCPPPKCMLTITPHE